MKNRPLPGLLHLNQTFFVPGLQLPFTAADFTAETYNTEKTVSTPRQPAKTLGLPSPQCKTLIDIYVVVGSKYSSEQPITIKLIKKQWLQTVSLVYLSPSTEYQYFSVKSLMN
jgi:hypothetical protein